MLKIETFAILLVASILFTVTSLNTVADACYQFSAKECIRCRKQTHLYNGICYRNILGCVQYQQGNRCVKCQDGVFNLFQSGCRLIKNNFNIKQLLSNLQRYSGNHNSSFADQYGESNFSPVNYNTIKNQPTFAALDMQIRSGDYSHFISKSKNPIYSVSYYQKNTTYSYKILYQGSGGGLFLCIADVEPSLSIDLRSLTPISASDIVSDCTDYDINGKCLICQEGSHLQGGRCYNNYGGCLKYYENICVECLDYYLLVQNRCVSDCLSISDTRNLLYYENYSKKVSTLQTYYGVSLVNFYITITTTTITTTTTKTTNKANFNTQNQNQIINTNNVKNERSGITILQNKNIQVIKPITFVSKNTQVRTKTETLQAPTVTTDIMNADDIFKNLSTEKSLLTTNTTTIAKQIVLNSACVEFNDQKCIKCQEYYFVNQQYFCEQISPLCIRISEETGYCIKCFENYVLNNGRCNLKN